MSLDPTTDAAHRLVVSSLVNYCTADEGDDAGMDVDVVGEHQTALIARCVEAVGAERLDTGGPAALAAFVELVIAELLLTSGALFRVAFEAVIADDDEDLEPHRAEVLAAIADGAAKLLGVEDDEHGAEH